MKRGRMLLLCAVIGAVSMAQASAQSFHPIRELNTWYTDRTPVDIEIVGSTSMLPQWHQLEPDRALRFRLERAYVSFFSAHKEPGFDLVTFMFDMQTGLPDSLFAAVAHQDRFHEDIPGVPNVPHSERMRRALRISLESDFSSQGLRNLSQHLSKCRGAPVGDGLSSYEWQNRRKDCSRPSLGGSEYVAPYENDLLLEVQCREKTHPGLGCQLRYPFGGFAVEIAFHRDHLPKWREMIERASTFLQSKQYR